MGLSHHEAAAARARATADHTRQEGAHEWYAELIGHCQSGASEPGVHDVVIRAMQDWLEARRNTCRALIGKVVAGPARCGKDK